MAAHRWWRCARILTPAAAVSVGELQFRSAAGTNLATGGVALASSYLTAAWSGLAADLTPDRAFDGKNSLVTDIWHVDTTSSMLMIEQWIGYRWPTAVDVGQVAVQQRGDGVADGYWTGCNIEASDDGVYWHVVGTAVFAAPTSAADKAFKVGAIQPVGGEQRPARSVVSTRGGAAPAVVGLVAADGRATSDIDGGPGVITGSVSALGPPVTPLVRRVLLLSERFRRVIKETWSEPGGQYTFSGLHLSDKYTVVTHDSAGIYRAVIADGLSAQEGP